MKSFAASDLGGAVLERLAEEARGVPIDQVILGQAVQAGCGPSPARAAARRAGLAPTLPAFAVNDGSASGMTAILQTIWALRSGAVNCGVAGGMESASSAPYLLPSARWGTRMGQAPVLDALLQDGGETPDGLLGAPHLAWAQESRTKAREARDRVRSEIIPLTATLRRGVVRVEEDEPLETPEGLPGHGDGAAALLLSTEAGLGSRAPLARIQATAQAPDVIQAIQRLLSETGLGIEAIDRFEVDEGAGVPSLVLTPPSHLDPSRVNVQGGAMALPQPQGAAGALLVVTLAHQLHNQGLHRGIAALESQGGAIALLLEHP